MPNLSELQTMMGEALRGRGPAAGTRPLLPLLDTRGYGAAGALDVARHNFEGTLVNALRTSFPAVGRLVGRAFFDHAAAAFVRGAPPRSPWLDSYGAGFPAFLRTLAVLAALPYIAEVAELEWLVNVALHARDVGAARIGARDLVGLAGLDDDAAGSVRLEAAPSFGLLRADHPVDAVWSAVLALSDTSAATPGVTAETAHAADTAHEAALAAIDLDAGPVWLCVSRQPHGIDVRRMPEPAWRFAAALRGGAMLAEAAHGLEDDIGALLTAHLAQGHFASFSIGA